MNRNNIIYIISAVIIVLSIVFALLINVWDGFTYFVLSLLTLLSLAWAGHLIRYYLMDFKEQAEEEFKLFKAETVNAKNITSEEFDKNEQAFRKEYNKKLIKYKVIHIAKITLCFGLAILFILGMVFA